MTQTTDDLAALSGKMVKEIHAEFDKNGVVSVLYAPALEAIARRYMEKAVRRARLAGLRVTLSAQPHWMSDEDYAEYSRLCAERAGKDGR